MGCVIRLSRRQDVSSGSRVSDEWLSKYRLQYLHITLLVTVATAAGRRRNMTASHDTNLQQIFE